MSSEEKQMKNITSTNVDKKKKKKVKSLTKQVIIVISHHSHRSKINLFHKFVQNVIKANKIYYFYLDQIFKKIFFAQKI